MVIFDKHLIKRIRGEMNNSSSWVIPELPSLAFVDDVSLILRILSSSNGSVFHLRTVEETCASGDVMRLFFQTALLPAIIIVLLFSFTQKRRNLFVDICYGRPAFAYPMDIFTRTSRASYSCAFGSTVYLIYKIVFERFYVFEIGGASYERSLATIASMLVYGMVYIPIFICITIGTVHGYGVGSLYIWTITLMELYNLISCDIKEAHRAILLAKRLPQLICLLYLCVRLPWKCVVASLERHFIIGSMENLGADARLESLKETYYGRHVVNLLQKPKEESAPEGGIARLRYSFSRVFSVFYKWESDFRYSSRLITTQLVGAMLLYQVAFEVISYAISLFAMCLQTLRFWLREAELAYLLDPTDEIERSKGVIDVSINILIIFRVFVLIALVWAFLLGLCNIVSAFSCYRRYQTAIFQGDYSKFTKRGNQVGNANLLTGCMRYAGYQVGYIAWGFVIQSIVLVIISFILSVLISLVMYDTTQWIIDLILAAWPVVFIAFVINFSQVLGARYVFLQENGNTLSLTNRRVFFTATYFIFFYNIFMGVFSCLNRVLSYLVFGLYLLPRLDHSVLPPSFRFRDLGYQAFVGFLLTESQHSHPVVLAFVRLIQTERLWRSTITQNSSGDIALEDENISRVQMTHFDLATVSTEEKEKQRKRALAKFQWHLAYSLLNNPSIRLMRKGYCQAEDKARALGLKLPKSDVVLSVDADTIREQTKTFLDQQEEKEKEKQRSRFHWASSAQNQEEGGLRGGARPGGDIGN